jgi:outer membrane protein TolC
MAALAMALLVTGHVPAQAAVTVDDAVRMALEKSSRVVAAEASVLDARSGVQRAYAGVLPRVGASLSRSGSSTDNSSNTGSQFFAGIPIPPTSTLSDPRSRATTPTVSGSWNILDLAAIQGLRASRSGLVSAEESRKSARQDVAFQTRQQFYNTVRAYHLARVADVALGVSRENERRVRALFEVGSVARSDLLQSQVQTAQSELDSINRHYDILAQRITLATLVGVPEGELGEVDTTLTVTVRSYDLEALLEEARQNRPDIRAADASLRAAKSSVTAAKLQRVPYVSISGAADFETRGNSYGTSYDRIDDAHGTYSNSSEADVSKRGQVAIVWDAFDFSIDGGITGARANVVRAQDNYNVLVRNLEADMRQALFAYQQSLEGTRVGERSVEAAVENLKLIQQKYNVGSATILDLNTAVANAQEAAVNLVGYRATVRIAEAAIERLRGRGD